PVRGGGRPYARACRTLRERVERIPQRASVLIERFNTTPNQGMVALRRPSQINLVSYDHWGAPDETRVSPRSDVRHELPKHDRTGRSVQGVEITIAASHIDGERSRNRVGRQRGGGSDALPATTGCRCNIPEQLLP